MIGFGSFGGFGFPTRRTMPSPVSGQVQSDDEFNQSWQDRLNATPRTMAKETSFSLVPKMQGGAWGWDDRRAADMVAQGREAAREDFERQAGLFWGDNMRPAASNIWETYQQRGYTPNFTVEGQFYTGLDPYNPANAGKAGDHWVTLTDQVANPEWERQNALFNEASKLRAENQTRQQQAYDTILGGSNAVGGVLPSGYSAPSFGQITGQAPDASMQGMQGMSDLTGVQDTTQTGQFMGAGRYSPSPFSPASFRTQNPWQGF